MEQTQFIVGVLMAYVIEFLKKLPWFPLITERATKAAKVLFAAVVAAGSALAISFAYDPGQGQLVVSGLTWSNVGAGLWAFLVSMLS